MAEDRLVRALVGDGAARLVWVDATETARRQAEVHGLSGESARLGAELVVASALMSAWVKGDERVMLQLQAEEPEVAYVGEIDADGHYRGRLTPARVEGTAHRVHGLMLAIKSDADKEMYRGVTRIDGEAVADALQAHLATSDQVRATVRIEAGLDGVARGLLVDLLPTAAGDELAAVDLQDAPLVQLLSGLEEGRLGDEPVDVLTSRPLVWKCRCSRERVLGMLRSLDSTTLREMIDEDGGAEISCHFCDTTYAVGVDVLGGILTRRA